MRTLLRLTFTVLLAATMAAAAADDAAVPETAIPVRVIDVADLVGASFVSNDPETPNDAQALEDLRNLITEMIAVDTWEDNGGPGGLTVSSVGHCLIIRQTDDVYREVEKLLAGLRKSVRTSIVVDMRLLCLDPQDRPAFLADNELSRAVLTDRQLQALLADTRIDRWTVASPRATVGNGRPATIRIGTVRRYVSGYLTAADGNAGAMAYKPITEELADGITLRLKASTPDARDRVTLTIRPRLQVMMQMTSSRQATHDGGPALTVEQPLGTLREMEATCSIPDNGAAIIGPLSVQKGIDAATQIDALREGRDLYVLVHVKIVEAK